MKDKFGGAANFSTANVSAEISDVKRIRSGDRSLLFHGRDCRSYGLAARASCFSVCWMGNMAPLVPSFCHPVCSHLGISPNITVYCIKDSNFNNVRCMYDPKYVIVIATTAPSSSSPSLGSYLKKPVQPKHFLCLEVDREVAEPGDSNRYIHIYGHHHGVQGRPILRV